MRVAKRLSYIEAARCLKVKRKGVKHVALMELGVQFSRKLYVLQ